VWRVSHQQLNDAWRWHHFSSQPIGQNQSHGPLTHEVTHPPMCLGENSWTGEALEPHTNLVLCSWFSHWLEASWPRKSYTISRGWDVKAEMKYSGLISVGSVSLELTDWGLKYLEKWHGLKHVRTMISWHSLKHAVKQLFK
jgi:hypothetical protein